LAALIGADPVGFRVRLLAADKRGREAVRNVASLAGWSTPAPAGSARGVAFHRSFGSWVAQVAELARAGTGFKITRMSCAIDCGQIINPDSVVAQMEG